MKPKIICILQKRLNLVNDESTDEFDEVPDTWHNFTKFFDDEESFDVCRARVNIGKEECGKPHSEHKPFISKMEEQDWEHVAFVSDLVEELQKKICFKYGHTVIDDQCGRPEHRYCVNCRESTPNEECNYDDDN